MPRDIPAHRRFIQIDEDEAVDLDRPFVRQLAQAAMDMNPDNSLENCAFWADMAVHMIVRAGLTLVPHVANPRIVDGWGG